MHWTISRLKDYEVCPKRYEYRYVLATPEPGEKSPALQRGIYIHESIEHYLDGTVPAMPSDIRPAWQAMVRSLVPLRVQPEQQWEFDAGWHPYTNNPEFPLWLRMKLDVNYRPKPDVHVVIDFKTGQHYPSNVEQVEVYALGAFAMFDDINEVRGELWYLDHSGGPVEKTYKRSQAGKLARKWEGRAGRMLDATDYPANPGRHCSWCPYKETCPQSFGEQRRATLSRTR